MSNLYSQAKVRRCLHEAFETQFVVHDGQTLAVRRASKSRSVDISSLPNPLPEADLNYVLHRLGIGKPEFLRRYKDF